MKKAFRILALILVLAFCLPVNAMAQDAVGPIQPDFEYGTGFADLSKGEQDAIIAEHVKWIDPDADPSEYTVEYFTGERAYFAGIYPNIYEWVVKDLDTATPYEKMKIRSARNYAVSHANGHGYSWCSDECGETGSSCSFDLENKVIKIIPNFHELFPLEWEEPHTRAVPYWSDLMEAEEMAKGNESLSAGMALTANAGKSLREIIYGAAMGLNGGSAPAELREAYDEASQRIYKEYRP